MANDINLGFKKRVSGVCFHMLNKDDNVEDECMFQCNVLFNNWHLQKNTLQLLMILPPLKVSLVQKMINLLDLLLQH